MSLLSLAVTLGGFLLGVALNRRLRLRLLNPTLIGIAVVMLYLELTRRPYVAYAEDTRPISLLLGPAVVSLAVPLYRQRALLRRHAPWVLLGVACGTVTAMGIGIAGAALLRLAPEWRLALATESATSPIALAVAEQLGGSGGLSAVIAILTGVLGSIIGPGWLTRLGVRHPLARGLAMGTASHGIGTARILEEGEVAGAAAGLGMGLGGLAVALTVPALWHLL
ncbi:putative murein hydrolase (TIGR00659 family) [Deinobacterium chartae]|uniref:Putative murein hydrolase (TIGR00659 family) n=1 Tax=Deinobacterium chartae TaxID=521158 RepID=A0A841HY88_9DEIO|nr:LrgB family protein [Deinobacterium chartae]MBB6097180.1 putative murein hydrolase (TIGR00659 family) [Deinobacterium chartae]